MGCNSVSGLMMMGVDADVDVNGFRFLGTRSPDNVEGDRFNARVAAALVFRAGGGGG
jgi:hypothetical protein